MVNLIVKITKKKAFLKKKVKTNYTSPSGPLR